MKCLIPVFLAACLCTFGCADKKQLNTPSGAADAQTSVDTGTQPTTDLANGDIRDDIVTPKDSGLYGDVDTMAGHPDVSDTAAEIVSPPADAVDVEDLTDAVPIADMVAALDINKDDIPTSSKQKCLCYPDGTFCPWTWIVAPEGQDLYDPSMKCPEGEICDGDGTTDWGTGYEMFVKKGYIGLCKRRCTQIQGKIDTMTDDLCGHGQYCFKINIHSMPPEERIVKVDAICIDK